MKTGMIEPDLVVDIKRIETLQRLNVSADGTEIGSAVPSAALGESAKLKSLWPGVVEAANLIGSDQIQGRCTIVGNLCNASPAADSVPALIAAGAKAIVVGAGGKRRVPVEKVVTGPGSCRSDLMNSLKRSSCPSVKGIPGMLICGLRPAPKWTSR